MFGNIDIMIYQRYILFNSNVNLNCHSYRPGSHILMKIHLLVRYMHNSHTIVMDEFPPIFIFNFSSLGKDDPSIHINSSPYNLETL